jgi:hypothetical protein
MSKSVIGGKIHCWIGARVEGAEEREEDGDFARGEVGSFWAERRKTLGALLGEILAER